MYVCMCTYQLPAPPYLIHRDLAARNIVLSADNVAKVSNFYLTRPRDFDHKGFNLPIKWTPPEALESGVCVRICSMHVCGIVLL